MSVGSLFRTRVFHGVQCVIFTYITTLLMVFEKNRNFKLFE